MEGTSMPNDRRPDCEAHGHILGPLIPEKLLFGCRHECPYFSDWWAPKKLEINEGCRRSPIAGTGRGACVLVKNDAIN